MDRLIRWSLENRLAVLILAVLLLLWGVRTTLNTPVDVFPDLTAPTVNVITEAHGLPTQEVETLVTFPIETALNGIPNVRRTRSASSAGISIVHVDFVWGTDIYHARQMVAEKLPIASASLPSGADMPILAPVTSIMGDVMFLAVEGDGVDLNTLRSEADWNIRRRLLAVPGVAQVIPMGGEVRQYQVMIRPEQLLAFRINVLEVMDALRESNVNMGGGVLFESSQEFQVRGLGRFHTTEDIGSVVVTEREGTPVLVQHLADVTVGPALKRGDGAFNAKPAVVIGIRKQPGINTLKLTERLDTAMDEIQATLPEGISINRESFRQANFISTAVRNISHALRDGGILVVLILFLFLAKWRASLISLSALPLSLFAAIIVLSAMGHNLNTMTLGGLTIAIGSLVDDAIIDVENVLRRLRENIHLPLDKQKPVLEVVYQASREVRKAIVFATVIIILVFAPLFFLTGVEQRLLMPLGIAYSVSLLASLVVALTVTPVLCYFMLGKSRKLEKESHKEPWVIRKVVGGYSKVLRPILHRPMLIIGLSLLGVVAAVITIPFIGRSFLPEFNEGAYTISIITLPGSSLEESNAVATKVEKILLKVPEVASTTRRTGRAEMDEHAQSIHASELEVVIKPGGRKKAEVMAHMRKVLGDVNGAVINIGQPISHRIDHMLSGTRAAIAVKIYGPNLETLRSLAQQVESNLKTVPGLVDLSADQLTYIPQVSIAYDYGAMAKHGLSAHELGEQVEAAVGGEKVNTVIEGARTYALVVRYPDAYRESFHELRNIPIGVKNGGFVPLRELARVNLDTGPEAVLRENGLRKSVVAVNVAGLDLHSAVNAIHANIAGIFEENPDYYYQLGGQFESEQRASRTILTLSVVVFFLVAFLLYAALESFKAAGIVLFNLPLALIGGVAGVWFMGGILDVASMVGFIALFGIAVRNGTLLVTRFQQLLQEGKSRYDAVWIGSKERIIPVVMTAMSTGLALVPLVLGMGEPGNEIQSPMAVVILGGLVTTTALNLVVIPALSLKYGFAPHSHIEQKRPAADQQRHAED